jgi:ribosomal protein S18 acetylase RimI-like enzyme
MIAYRDAGLDDAALLAEVSGKSFAETFGHLYAEEDLRTFLAKLSEPAWYEELEDPRIDVRIAEEEGEACGFAKLGPISLPVDPAGPAAELRQLYLLEPWQGRGIGRTLMDWALDQARQRGAREMYLSVWAENFRAQRFYRGYGFTFVRPYAFMVGDQADEDEIWRLEL